MKHHDEHEPTRRPVLRLTRGPGTVPDPVDAPFAVEHLSVLAHEMGNLLDGSMRCLGLVRRALEPLGCGVRDDHLEEARRRVETVYASLERMADLVHAAMRGSGSPLGSPTTLPSRPITLGEALTHAAEVVAPEAGELGIDVLLAAAPELEEVPAGPMYSVILNGLRNAVDSIRRCGDGGRIEVRAGFEAAPGSAARLITIEVRDDGVGLPPGLDGNRAMDLGFSTKPGGLGVGLALAREVVRGMAGTIDLMRRSDPRSPARPGAVLRIVYPASRPRPDRSVG